ncbi:MAG: Gfo/Idh/MocA family oxidoreductase [Candidatus Latescibacteria bacterium]|nr:Gfo/Idh/MocA family oxidoreductase [Candidatus Latescibacterota bacterium]
MAKRKTMSTVRVGVIGCGGIARGAHMPAYAALKDAGVEVVACADVDEGAARRLAEQFSIPHAFADYHQMLKIQEIDAVSVCTPNFLHRDPTVAALRAGKHVLCEKPIARNAREGGQMVAAAKAAKRKLMIDFNNRYTSGAQALKRLADSGTFGHIYYARAQALRRRGVPTWGVFTDKEKQGGGPLIDIGVHILDLTLHLMGFPKPVTVSGRACTEIARQPGVSGIWGAWDTSKYTVEDFAVGLIRFENGATVVLESSFCLNAQEVFSTSIMGTKGGADLTPLKVYSEAGGVQFDATPQRLPEVKSHQKLIEAFVRSIQDDAPAPVPGEQALVVTQILDAIYKSSEAGKEVRIG